MDANDVVYGKTTHLNCFLGKNTSTGYSVCLGRRAAGGPGGGGAGGGQHGRQTMAAKPPSQCAPLFSELKGRQVQPSREQHYLIPT